MNKKRKDIINNTNEKIKKYTTHLFDEDRKVRIDMTIHDFSSFLSPYSSRDDYVISQEAANFLESRLENLFRFQEARLYITAPSRTEEEKERYEKAIRAYFAHQALVLKHKLFVNFWTGIGLIILSAIVFVLMVWLNISKKSEILSEMIDVVATVFMWEAVQDLYFNRKELRNEEKSTKMGLNMDIVWCIENNIENNIDKELIKDNKEND